MSYILKYAQPCRRGLQLAFLFAILSLLSPWTTVSADRTASEYFVKSLPGAPPGPLLKMHAGHIEVSEEHHGSLFFGHFQNQHISDRHRTVIWLNGGPGCSSEDGALMEIGPYRVRDGGKLEYSNGSWDEFANVLFVDNPVGTGFSYVDTDSFLHELPEMAEQFITFLQSWFRVFPEYEGDDLYLAGESYAGQHLPYIARAMLDRNKESSAAHWNLKGILIGNGWTSPQDQYPAYLAMAYKSGLLKEGSEKARSIEAQQAVCDKKLKDGGVDHVDTPDCEAILTDILSATLDSSASSHEQCVNMYDVRLRDSYPSCGMSWPPDLDAVTTYLRLPEVVRALNIDPAKKTGWTECNGAVGSAFRARRSAPAIKLLPGLIEEVPVVLFSGDQDLICNHIGTEELIKNMEWNGGKGFETSPGVIAPRRPWTFEGEPAGIYQEARNLTYILFYNSSHMVPFDYPRRTRDMLDRFMGVDIASIGGTPSDSRIDGEKGLETSVGGHPNSTVAEEEENHKLQEAKWNAYYRSGEVVLIIVIIAAGLWGWYVWRDRRRRAGYQGVIGSAMDEMRDGMRDGLPLENFRNKAQRDLEAADFDERTLDDANASEGNKMKSTPAEDRISLSSDDEDSSYLARTDGHKAPH